MAFQEIPAGADLNTVISTLNNTIRDLNNKEVTETFKDSTGVRRLLLGQGSNGFNGFKVSEEGKDVFTALDSELIFNSDQNVFKIVAEGNGSAPDLVVADPGAGLFGSDTGTTTIAHNLGYVPIIIAFIQQGSNYISTPLIDYSGSGATAVWTTYLTEVDATNIYFTTTAMVYGDGSSVTGQNIKYYLLQETAN